MIERSVLRVMRCAVAWTSRDLRVYLYMSREKSYSLNSWYNHMKEELFAFPLLDSDHSPLALLLWLEKLKLKLGMLRLDSHRNALSASGDSDWDSDCNSSSLHPIDIRLSRRRLRIHITQESFFKRGHPILMYTYTLQTRLYTYYTAPTPHIRLNILIYSHSRD